MNYLAIYENLINKARNRGKPEGYYERHHIVPRCLGGTDHYDNIVKLTPEEHFLAHLLLAKGYKTHVGLWLACHMMTIHHTDNRCKNKSYGFITRNVSKLSKGRPQKGINAMKGAKHKEETKQQISKNTKIALRQGWAKPVYQFDFDGNLLYSYDAITDAAQAVGTNSSNILYTCEGKFNHCKGYIWEWTATTARRIKERHGQRKIQTPDGLFDSVKSVMEHYNFTSTAQVRQRCLADKHLEWQYID